MHITASGVLPQKLQVIAIQHLAEFDCAQDILTETLPCRIGLMIERMQPARIVHIHPYFHRLALDFVAPTGEVELVICRTLPTTALRQYVVNLNSLPVLHCLDNRDLFVKCHWCSPLRSPITFSACLTSNSCAKYVSPNLRKRLWGFSK